LTVDSSSDGDVESVGELDDYIKSRVSPSAFQPADVGAVEVDVICEGFLGCPSAPLAQIAKALAKRDAMRRLTHISTLAIR